MKTALLMSKLQRVLIDSAQKYQFERKLDVSAEIFSFLAIACTKRSWQRSPSTPDIA
jgi:hypothetical protein